MSTIHLRVTLQPVGDKHAATIRREDGIPFGLTRAFPDRVDAERWLVENVKAELATQDDEGAAA